MKECWLRDTVSLNTPAAQLLLDAMHQLIKALNFSEQEELIPDIRPEDIPDSNPFNTDEDPERRPDQEVWEEDDEEDEYEED